MLVQVKVPIHNSILAPKCIQERLARVPSAQSGRYIVNEMYSMPIIGHLEEERRASNCTQDTTCSDTLDFPKDMYPGQAHIAYLLRTP